MGYTVHFYVRPASGWDAAFDEFSAVAADVVAASGGQRSRLTVAADRVVYSTRSGEDFWLHRDQQERGGAIPELNGDWFQRFAKTPDPVVPALLVAAKVAFGEMLYPVTDVDASSSDPVWGGAMDACRAVGLEVDGVKVGVFPLDLPAL